MDFEENEFESWRDGPREDPMDFLKSENLLERIRELEGDLRWNHRDAELYLELAVLYDCAHDSENAVKAYYKVLELEPRQLLTHSLLAEHFFGKKRYWDAAMEFGHYVAVAAEDCDGTLYLKLGIACLRLGRTEDARRHLEKARHDEDNGRAWMANKLLSKINPGDNSR